MKWDRAYQAKYGITTREASELPQQVLARIDRMARRIYRALRARWRHAPLSFFAPTRGSV